MLSSGGMCFSVAMTLKSITTIVLTVVTLAVANRVEQRPISNVYTSSFDDLPQFKEFPQTRFANTLGDLIGVHNGLNFSGIRKVTLRGLHAPY